MPSASRPKVILAVCTYYRNGPLTLLLERVAELSRTHWTSVDIGVTVVDDSPEGQARPVADAIRDLFPLSLEYCHCGHGNISLARNMAIENAMHRGDFIAMTDDDCEPHSDWLAELMSVQAATGAQAATGLMLRRAPEHAPKWLTEQPFLELGEFDAKDGQDLETGYTNNCLLKSSVIRENPQLRFDPALGKTGGEDMVFFQNFRKAGNRIAFAAKAFVYENEPDERLTLRYQVGRYFWHGNSSIVTSLRAGQSRPRMGIHAGATIARAALHPVRRIGSGKRPQLLYSLAKLSEGLGKLVGVFGIQVDHH